MRPYGVEIIEFPDVDDIQKMGCKSSVGKLKRGRGYIRTPDQKAKTRRYWARKEREESKRLSNESFE